MIPAMKCSAWMLCAVLVVACGGTAGVGPSQPDSIDGTYILESINGTPLPYGLLDIGGELQYTVLADLLTFNPNGTAVETNTTRKLDFDVASTQTQTGSGRFTQTGTAVTVIWPSGISIYTVLNDALSVREPLLDDVWLYRKR